MKLTAMFFLAFLMVTGCAHVFSENADSLVDQTLTFDKLKVNPKAFVGKYIKLGGIIVQTKNTKEGSEVEIVQFKLGSDDIPDETSPSGGRFLAVTPEYVDGMVYKSGRPVALIGVVKGEKTLPLSEIDYTYPVVSIVEIHVWREAAMYPPPPYPPYYYGYYNYWWYGPPYRYGPPWWPYW